MLWLEINIQFPQQLTVSHQWSTTHYSFIMSLSTFPPYHISDVLDGAGIHIRYSAHLLIVELGLNPTEILSHDQNRIPTLENSVPAETVSPSEFSGGSASR